MSEALKALKSRNESTEVTKNAEATFDIVGRMSVFLYPEQFAHALDLAAADGNFGLLFVAHFEHVAGLEPRHHFLDVMDVHQEGAMRTPEGIGLERGA